jgi:hypothetical protein
VSQELAGQRKATLESMGANKEVLSSQLLELQSRMEGVGREGASVLAESGTRLRSLQAHNRVLDSNAGTNRLLRLLLERKLSLKRVPCLCDI